MAGSDTSKRGFASMDEDKQRDIARVPVEKRSFSKDHELASEAGRKGGQNVADEKRSFSKDRELASEAGRKGKESSHIGDRSRGGRESSPGRIPWSGTARSSSGGIQRRRNLAISPSLATFARRLYLAPLVAPNPLRPGP